VADARSKIGKAPDVSRNCGIQPAHQSLITDVLQATPPPMRDCIKPPNWRIDDCVLSIDSGHQSVVLIAPSVSSSERQV
jgi:hypothetical protein